MYLRGLGAGPQYMDTSGRPISAIPCGTPYTFDVPGYHEVWLDQTHNGQPGYSGTFPVPMAPYTANCAGELGTWLNTVYTVTPQGTRGTFLGSDSLQIVPQQSGGGPGTGPPVAPPAPFTCPPGYYVTKDAQSGLPACAALPSQQVTTPGGTFLPTGTPAINPPVPLPTGSAGTGAPPLVITSTGPSFIPPPVSAPADPLPWIIGAAVVLYLASRPRRG